VKIDCKLLYMNYYSIKQSKYDILKCLSKKIQRKRPLKSDNWNETTIETRHLDTSSPFFLETFFRRKGSCNFCRPPLSCAMQNRSAPEIIFSLGSNFFRIGNTFSIWPLRVRESAPTLHSDTTKLKRCLVRSQLYSVSIQGNAKEVHTLFLFVKFQLDLGRTLFMECFAISRRQINVCSNW